MATTTVAEAYGIGTTYEVTFDTDAGCYLASVSSGPSTRPFGWEGRFDWQSMGDVLEAVGRAIEVEIMEEIDPAPAGGAGQYHASGLRSGLLGDTPAEERRRGAVKNRLGFPACGCECTTGGFCGGCGHVGCGRL